MKPNVKYQHIMHLYSSFPWETRGHSGVIMLDSSWEQIIHIVILVPSRETKKLRCDMQFWHVIHKRTFKKQIFPRSQRFFCHCRYLWRFFFSLFDSSSEMSLQKLNLESQTSSHHHFYSQKAVCELVKETWGTGYSIRYLFEICKDLYTVLLA